jgi:hypothetical protein
VSANRSRGRYRLRPGDRAVVRLVKLAKPDVEYPVVVEADDGIHLVVRGPWAEPAARDLGFVTFEAGDIFTEHYWRDRWYSVKEVRQANGELKGWYCDVTRPVLVREGAIGSEDLELDLWVSADRAVIMRLDEDDFAASGLDIMDPVAAGRALSALDELERMAEDGFRSLAATEPSVPPTRTAHADPTHSSRRRRRSVR